MKNLNLIKWLWDDSHEKQKKRSVRRGAAVLLLLLTCVTHAWAATFSYTFKAGTTIYYDFTAISGGANWHDGSNLNSYDASAGGKIKAVTFASDVTMNQDWWVAKTATGGWENGPVKLASAPGTGQNVIVIGSDGKSMTWGTTTFAIAMDKDDWDTNENKSTTGSVEITLAAHKTYGFKVVYKGPTEKWCGMSSSWVSSSISNYQCTWDGGDNIYLMTAGAGKYTFTYDFTNNQISVTYPSVTHPSADYCYLQNYSWSNTYLELHTSDDATYPTKGWPGQQLHSPATTTIGEVAVYYYAMGSNYTEIQLDDNSGNYTGYQTPTYGQYLNYNNGWGWRTWSFTVTLTNQVTTATAPSNPSVQFNGTAPSDITAPTCSFYTFGGYYTAAGGGGSQVITNAGKWNASVSGYTDGSQKWIHEGGTATLFGKWTQNITLNQNGATTSGSTSLSATYNAVLDASGITNPEKDYYDFGGWTNGTGGSGSVVINTSKAVQTVSSWTDSNKKWIHNAASTLYAKWTEHPYTVTATAGEGGSVGSASYTGKVVTTCAISATPATGYKFSHWSVESGSATFADQYSASTTMNATSDAEIKANFVYRWSIAGSWLNYPETENWDADTYAMGNITKVSGDDICSIDITLPANTSYIFDVVDRSSSPYTFLKNGNDQIYYMTYGNSTDWGFGTTSGYNYDCGITTAGAGTYTFTWNITDGQLTVTYPTSYQVTAAVSPTGTGTATPSSATYMSTSVGGEITATPNYSHYFNGWTSNAGGTFTDASAATTTFKPASAAATVTAAFAERTAFIEGNFQVYNSSRDTRTKTGNSWQDESTNIKMTYDAVNNRYYLHTYSTPAELAAQVNSADAYFYVKTSTSSSSIADAAIYKAYSSDVQSLTAYGSSNKKATGSSSHSFKFTGSEDGYVIIYFNGTHVWYELECALSYYGGEDATGDAPAERTYYAYNSNQTAASNTYSKAGYVFDHWDTASDDSGSDYDEGDTDVAMNAREVCLHAMWKVRYGLYGSLDSNDGSKDTELAGMPGWPTTDPAYEPAAFSYSDGTYTISRTLTAPNTTYKFRVVDHTDNTSYGLATKTVIPENTATKLGSTLADAQLATAGTGSYTFTVVEDDGYPKVTIVNPLSYSITYGINGGNGSWTSVEDGEGNAITSGQYVKNGGSIIFTASPNTGYQVEGWYSDASCETAYVDGSDGATISGAGDIVLTLTVGKARTVYVKFEPKTYDGDIAAVTGIDGEYTATYGATTIDITAPTRDGYEVEAYYLTYNAGYQNPYSNPIATAAGVLATSTTYTDDDGKWDYTGDAPTIYANWVPKSYTITLSPELSPTTGTNGSPYFTVTIGGNNYRFGEGKDMAMTKPTREGYTFNGYWTASSGGNQIFNASGGIVGGVSGYTDASSNWDNTTDDLVLHAQWTDNGTYYFKGGASGNETSWNTASNWTKGQAPDDATDNVYILAPVVIPASATTSVNSVRIATNGSYTPIGGSAITADGKLTIPATAMLKVTIDVQNYDFSTSSASATTTATLHIQSASSGNGALVWGSTSSTPGAAQVDFYTKSSAGGTGTGTTSDVNQYIGTPFSDESNYYNYYNSWVFQVNAAGTAWERLPMGSTMDPFVGYDVIYDGAAGHTFEMEGTLVTNADKTCTLAHTNDDDENLLANSWTAPMWIKGFEVSDFTNADAAIYIFNSTNEDATAAAGGNTGVGPGGNYTAYTPGTSDAYIPSMQSFSVLSNGGGAGSVTLDYTDLVKNPASHSHIGAMYAPRRVEAEEPENEMTFLRLRVDDENGWADELKIYIREDFVYDFENGFDARKMYGDERAPMLYGMSIDGMMAIHCIPTAENQVVGFHAGTASSEYTFRFTYDGEEELYLKDTKLNTLTLIDNENSYHFYAAPSDSDMRFIIVKNAPQNPTGVDKLGTDANVQKIMHDGVMYILRGGRIYDATGALVK